MNIITSHYKRSFFYEIIFLLAVTIIFFILKIPTLNLPLYWDEPLYNGIPHTIFPRDRIPLFEGLIEFSAKCLGGEIIHRRVVSLILSIISSLMFYSHLRSNIGRIAASWGLLLLLLTPIFFAQSAMILPDLSSILICLLLLRFRKKSFIYCLLAVFATFYREFLMATVIAILIEYIWHKEQLQKKIIFYLIPIFIYPSFLLLRYLFLPQVSFHHSLTELYSLNQFHQKISQNFYWAFIAQGRWTYLCLLIFFLKRHLNFHIFCNKNIVYFLIIITIFITESFSDGFVLRYFFLIFPLYIYISLKILPWQRKPFWSSGLCLIILLIQIGNIKPNECSTWYSRENFSSMEHSMDYTDVIDSYTKALKFIKTKYPSAIILAPNTARSIGQNFNLNLSKFDLHQDEDQILEIAKPKFDILIFATNSNPREKIILKKLIVKYQLLTIGHFGKDCKNLIIYKQNSYQSTPSSHSIGDT